MPNYKVTSRLVDGVMIPTAVSLCGRRIAQARTGFPLTPEHVRAMLAPERWRETFEQMRREGIDTVQKTSTSVTIIDQSMAGVERTVLLRLEHPSEFYTDHSVTSTYHIEPKFKRGDELDKLIFPRGLLSDDEQAALSKWVNNIVQETRLTTIAKGTIGSFLRSVVGSGLTIAHVIARWPGLRYLVQDDRMWVDRFNNAPRNLKPYGWSSTSSWHAKYAKAMALTDMVLTSAAMLPTEIKNDDAVKAALHTWRSLPTDLDKPA